MTGGAAAVTVPPHKQTWRELGLHGNHDSGLAGWACYLSDACKCELECGVGVQAQDKPREFQWQLKDSTEDFDFRAPCQ